MDTKALEEKYKKLIGDPFVVHSVDHANFKPHPYMIGAKHVCHASDHFHGMLGVEAIEDAEKHGIHCENGTIGNRCHLPYKEHTSDTVIFLKLTRNATNTEAGKVLFAVKAECEADKIDGFAFIESGFRIK